MGSRPLWLIARQGSSRLEVLTTGGGHELPVFSFKDEAEAFLYLEDASTGWQARETTCGELISVLYGPCREAEHVSLDPLPKTVKVVGLSRKAFVEALLVSEIPFVVEEPEVIGAAS